MPSNAEQILRALDDQLDAAVELTFMEGRPSNWDMIPPPPSLP